MANLLNDSWLPVRREDGSHEIIGLSEIADDWRSNPIVDFNWPRPDLRVASYEFVVGLLATACPPGDSRDWLDWWREPPEPDALAEAFAPYADAFNLDGPGPRFLQDSEDLVSGAEPIERLLIEAPGDSTVKKNTDLLVHRGQTASLGRPAAAIALYAFQSWAPAGGAGNRTGLRGGGPMTTLVLPGAQRSLWHTLWANVPEGFSPDAGELTRVFPWLTPTPPPGRGVTPDDVHPLQCWWGMPRRIRLDFTPCDQALACGLTGTPDTVQVATWRQRPQGSNYAGWGDIHPLTPRYRVKAGSEILPLHPQPGGVGYRHWLGLVVSDVSELRFPASAVRTWRGQRQRDVWGRDEQRRHMEDRLLATGFDMDNMKVRSFVESELPLPAILDDAVRKRVDDFAGSLVRGAEHVANLLRRAVRDALFGAGASVKLDWELLSAVREQLWDATDADFYAALSTEARRLPDTPDDGRLAWLKLLRTKAQALFDAAAPLDADGATLPRSDEGIRRLLAARRNLGLALNGYRKEGEALFVVLQLPTPERKVAKKGRAR